MGNNKPDNSIFLSQLPLHLQKIHTIWNKLVYVGWVETTFTNLDKTLLKLIHISEKNEFDDLYYQTVDIHRIFTDIISEKRTPSVYEFKIINEKITALCNDKTLESINPNIRNIDLNIKKIALLHINSKQKGTHYIFNQKPKSKMVHCFDIETLYQIDQSHELDAVLIYLEDKTTYEHALQHIHHNKLKCQNLIAISPRTDAHIRIQSIRMNCSDYLQVPINEQQLISIIDSKNKKNEQIQCTGLFQQAKDAESLKTIFNSKNINLTISLTPLDIIHDCIQNNAQVILIFDMEQRVLSELIPLIQSHPNTCLLPVIYAASTEKSTKQNQLMIQEQLNENAIHYLPNCNKKLNILTNKIATLGQHLTLQIQHNKLSTTENHKLLEPEEFIKNFHYVSDHIEKDQIKASHYFFNIKTSYESSGKQIKHLGFSQVQKLSTISQSIFNDHALNNDIICKHGDFNYLIIKESIDEDHAHREIKNMCEAFSSIELINKPFEIKIDMTCVGVLIDNKRSLDSLIDFTYSVLKNKNPNTDQIRILSISNADKILSINNFSSKNKKEINNKIKIQENNAAVVKAFKDDGVFMKYQPIVDVKQNLAVFEAYARLCDTNNHCFDPGIFFPVLIQQNLAHEFNRKIIDRTLTELSSNNKISQEADLILKLLPSNDSNEDILNKILPWFSSQLSTHRLLGKNRIIFELSEPWVIKHFEQAKSFTEKVKALECSICLDHSDINETTLKIAQSLQPSYIKIEPSIKRNIISHNNNEVNLVLKELANSPTQLVASCVETSEEFSALWDKGIRYFQGYYVQQPMDQPEFLKLEG